jgi:hypothetical protein
LNSPFIFGEQYKFRSSFSLVLFRSCQVSTCFQTISHGDRASRPCKSTGNITVFQYLTNAGNLISS